MTRSQQKQHVDVSTAQETQPTPFLELDGKWRLEQKVGEELARLARSVVSVQSGLAPIASTHGNELSLETLQAMQGLDILTQVLEDLSMLFLALGQNPEICNRERRRLIATGRLQSLSDRLLSNHTQDDTPSDAETPPSQGSQIDIF